MIAANPQIFIAAIWEHIADQHAVTVAYPTLRTYVTTRRAATKTPGHDGFRGISFPNHDEPRP